MSVNFAVVFLMGFELTAIVSLFLSLVIVTREHKTVADLPDRLSQLMPARYVTKGNYLELKAAVDSFTDSFVAPWVQQVKFAMFLLVICLGCAPFIASSLLSVVIASSIHMALNLYLASCATLPARKGRFTKSSIAFTTAVVCNGICYFTIMYHFYIKLV